jgi:cytochrome c-type biogenesis protein
MFEWLLNTLGSPGFSPLVLLAAYLFGLVGSMSCSACHFAVLGAVAGYSGAYSVRPERKWVFLDGLSFMLGSTIALAGLGAAAGFIGQTASSLLGVYWHLLAGFVMIIVGLSSLDLLPFRLALPKALSNAAGKSRMTALVYGFAIGGGTSACSAVCNPVLPIALGVAALQGQVAWGAAMLAAFALGYSLPLTLGLIGLSLGFSKVASIIRGSASTIKAFAGALLIGFGFYLLATA